MSSDGLQVAEQRLDVGDVLRHLPARRDGQCHCLQRATKVAVQLAVVGDACVGGEVGTHVDHLLQRSACRLITAELDLRVDEHRVGAGELRRDAVRRKSDAQCGAEVVARERQGAEADRCVDVACVARQYATKQGFGACVVRGIGRLARLLQLAVGALRQSRGVRGRRAGGRRRRAERVKRTQRHDERDR